jgi:hypothetical protein
MRHLVHRIDLSMYSTYVAHVRNEMDSHKYHSDSDSETHMDNSRQASIHCDWICQANAKDDNNRQHSSVLMLNSVMYRTH